MVLVLLALGLQGQDSNWDLRNYHLYTPSALLDGRFDGDIAAAQLQTWHNPTLDFPFALMVRAGLPGWVVALWLALPAFIAVLFALRLLDLLWPERRSVTRTALAGLTAVAGASVMPSIGTTFNDAFVAAGVMAALWWIVDSQGRRGAWATWVPAGLLAGLCAGLKLTGALYCVGFIGAALACGPMRGAPSRILALALGGVAGAALTAGPWALHLWQEHGNPLFPYFNEWFLSPDAMPQGHKDERFIPRGLDALLVPFHLLTDSSRFSEGKLSDPRLLLGLASLVVWWVAAWRNRRQDANFARVANALLVFALLSLAVWVKLYGIYRYLFALEALCSIAIIGVLSTYLPVRWGRAAMTVVAVLLVVGVNRPGWGRDRFSTPMISVHMPPVPSNSLVMLADDNPMAYAVAYLPKTVAAISIQNNFMTPSRCTGLQAAAEQRVRQQKGPIYVLRKASKDPVPEALRAYGLVGAGACLPARTSLDELELCPLGREPTAPICVAAAPGP
ncbi:hypothetical protein ASD72_11915 [Pseudoxanthomonas sp. Root630]|nr:hypothetical protein ASD72_11915 [Pseudoxanthomonas sp. Root630]